MKSTSAAKSEKKKMLEKKNIAVFWQCIPTVCVLIAVCEYRTVESRRNCLINCYMKPNNGRY